MYIFGQIGQILYLSNFPRYTVDMSTYIIKVLIAEQLGEASNRSAQSRNAFVCMYIILYICIYICPNQLLTPSSIAQ